MGPDTAATSTDPKPSPLLLRSQLRRALARGLFKLALAVVLIGGLFALAALGGDGNPGPDGSVSGIFRPHTADALNVVLLWVSLGLAIALVKVIVYLFRAARLAKRARTSAQDRPRRRA
jgi:hypothetical protein